MSGIVEESVITTTGTKRLKEFLEVIE